MNAPHGRSRHVLASLLVAAQLLTGCLGEVESATDDERDDAAEHTGKLLLQLSTVPDRTVHCVRIVVESGGRLRPRNVPVTPGVALGTIDVGHLPFGAATINGSAFTSTCEVGGPAPAEEPTWLSKTARADVQAGPPVVVGVVFYPNEPVSADVTFRHPVQQVATGKNTTYVLTTQGTVWAFGANDVGQCGNGATSTTARPGQVLNLTDVVQIAAGATHACALKADQTVWCWGGNDRGQLGLNDRQPRATPQLVSELPFPIGHIAAGGAHSCATYANTERYACWGSNAFSEILPNTADVLRPVFLGSFATTIATATGYSQVCQLEGSGTLGCVGAAPRGENGTNGPVQVSPVIDVAMGDRFGCAIRGNDRLYCWGINGSGQVGDGTTTQRDVPTLLSSLGATSQVSTGKSHACALLTSGAVRCWGANADGQLGNQTTTVASSPVAVIGAERMVQVAAGETHSCSIDQDGALWCWGSNRLGELGTADKTTRFRATRVDF
jgi:alpha-tubulin suppressor-like RCC1 family protein